MGLKIKIFAEIFNQIAFIFRYKYIWELSIIKSRGQHEEQCGASVSYQWLMQLRQIMRNIRKLHSSTWCQIENVHVSNWVFPWNFPRHFLLNRPCSDCLKIASWNIWFITSKMSSFVLLPLVRIYNCSD